MPKRKPLNTAAFASAAVPRPDPVEEATAPLESTPRPAPQAGSSRADKVQIQGYFSKETRRRLKTLAAAEERTLEDLLGEALNLLFAKRGIDEVA